MVRRHGGPVVLRGSLVTWEREFRARLAVTEEEGELARMRDAAHHAVARVQTEAQSEQARLTREVARVQTEMARVTREATTREASLTTARKALKDLRTSRVYRAMRRLGRWASLERDIRNALK